MSVVIFRIHLLVLEPHLFTDWNSHRQIKQRGHNGGLKTPKAVVCLCVVLDDLTVNR